MRRLLVLAAVALVLVAGAAPAWAHEEISPSSVPTGRPAYLVLSVANEKRVDLTKVTVTAPTGGLFGHATRDPGGWTSTLSHTVITWTGGAVKPSRFEQFGFDIEQFGQPGAFVYKVNLAYTDGSTSDVDVPVVAVTDGSAPAVGTPATTVAGGTATTVAEHEEGGEEAAGAARDSKGESRANLALGLSVFALLAAIGAFFAGRRSAPAPGSTSGTKPAGGQDW
ncbi:MAG: hypothetical protein ACRD2W_01705 [Acidimicrobiales bacterium]